MNEIFSTRAWGLTAELVRLDRRERIFMALFLVALPAAGLLMFGYGIDVAVRGLLTIPALILGSLLIFVAQVPKAEGQVREEGAAELRRQEEAHAVAIAARDMRIATLQNPPLPADADTSLYQSGVRVATVTRFDGAATFDLQDSGGLNMGAAFWYRDTLFVPQEVRFAAGFVSGGQGQMAQGVKEGVRCARIGDRRTLRL